MRMKLLAGAVMNTSVDWITGAGSAPISAREGANRWSALRSDCCEWRQSRAAAHRSRASRAGRRDTTVRATPRRIDQKLGPVDLRHVLATEQRQRFRQLGTVRQAAVLV